MEQRAPKEAPLKAMKSEFGYKREADGHFRAHTRLRQSLSDDWLQRQFQEKFRGQIVRMRRFAAVCRTRLQEKEAELAAVRLERDQQMRDIERQLSAFEEELRCEQRRIVLLLQEKDSIIERQRREIALLRCEVNDIKAKYVPKATEICREEGDISPISLLLDPTVKCLKSMKDEANSEEESDSGLSSAEGDEIRSESSDNQSGRESPLTETREPEAETAVSPESPVCQTETETTVDSPSETSLLSDTTGDETSNAPSIPEKENFMFETPCLSSYISDSKPSVTEWIQRNRIPFQSLPVLLSSVPTCNHRSVTKPRDIKNRRSHRERIRSLILAEDKVTRF